MKIVHINATYGVGSTGQIVKALHETALAAEHESYAFWATSAKEFTSTPNVYRIGNALDHKFHALLRRLGGLQGSHSKIATLILCKQLTRLKPDVVHLHNLHSNYINISLLLNHLADMQVEVVITLHDCWFLTGYCTHYIPHQCMQWQNDCKNCPAVRSHWKKRQVENRKTYLKGAFARMKRVKFVGVSPWITEAGKIAFLGNHISHSCIYNWVDTSVFFPMDSEKQIRNEYDIPDNHKIITGVAQAWSAEKGLIEMLAIADKLRDKATLLLVGEQNCAPTRSNIRYLGRKKQQELVMLYSAADVFVNPSRMETFGLVTAEAMACGTPVVCYDNTAFKDIVSPLCGMIVPDGDVNELCRVTNDMLNSNKNNFSILCSKWVKEKFSKNIQIERYINLYSSK